jgi:hypothetical protein
MARNRPSRLRRTDARHTTTPIPGVPMATSRALDRLARPEVSSPRVRDALVAWQRVASLSRADLGAPHNDWTEFVGPMIRGELEQALLALPRRHAALLRAVVDPADDEFRAKTLNNPKADPSRPWWERRWWH